MRKEAATVYRVENGWVVSLPNEDAETFDRRELVVQEVDSPLEDGTREAVEAWAEALLLLDEHIGPSTSKYSPARLRIVLEPGEKYEKPKAAPKRRKARGRKAKP